MKVELQLEVSQHQIFELLTQSIIKDIKDTTGKEIAKEDINQYQYKKSITTKLGVTNSVEVVIGSYVEPSIYEAKVISDTGDYTFRYEISYVDESNCFVSYEERYQSNQWRLRLNHAIFSMMYAKKGKRRLMESIRQMEYLILHPDVVAAQASTTTNQNANLSETLDKGSDE